MSKSDVSVTPDNATGGNAALGAGELRADAPNLTGGRSFSHGAAILIVVLVSLPLLLSFAGMGDPVDMMELFNLVPVKEAARDGHWLMPTLNGAPRFEKPPLAVWIPAVLVKLTGSDSLWILRFPSVLLGILTALATYGLGCRLFGNSAEPRWVGGGRWVALFAALLVPVFLWFNRESRLASYDIYATAFTTCCMYALVSLAEAGYNELGPARATAGRWLLWTGLAGLSLGAALLSKGPAPPATVLVPFLIWVLRYHRRKGVLLALPVVAVTGALLAAAWAITILTKYPAAWDTWSFEAVKLTTGRRGIGAEVDTTLRDPWFYYLQIFLWVVPLTPTLIAGLVMPFLPAKSVPVPSARESRGRWLMWLVIVVGLVILSFPSEKKGRYALQLFPFAALLCAAVWQEFMRVRANTKVDAAGALVLGAQALCFIVPGIVGMVAAVWVLAAGGFGKWAGTAGATVTEMVHATGAPLMIALFLIVLGLGLWLWHLLARQKFRAGMFALAACAWMLTLSGQWVYRGLPETHTNSVHLPEAKALADAGDLKNLYTLRHSETERGADYRPWLSSLYFANRILPVVDPEHLAEVTRKSPNETILLMLITGQWDKHQKQYITLPAVEGDLRKVEALTGRQGEEIGRWDDEGRLTILVRFAAKPSLP